MPGRIEDQRRNAVAAYQALDSRDFAHYLVITVAAVLTPVVAMIGADVMNPYQIPDTFG